MTIPAPGAIDCDIHPALPSTHVLLPYLDEYWRAHVQMRGLERDNYNAAAFPVNAPINARPDWKPAKGYPGCDFDTLRTQALDGFGTRYAICNVLHGAQAIFSEDLSAAFCRAINDWVVKEWLDRDPRLRASIVVPMHSPDLAAARSSVARPIRASSRCWCGKCRRFHWAGASTGRFIASPSNSICRSGFMPAVRTGIRRPIWVGRRITWKTTFPGRPVSPAC